MIKLIQIRKFVITLVIFTLISFSFSTVGLMFEDHPQSMIIGNPLEVSGISIQHILGHIFWGMIAGLLSLRLNYVFLCGGFALLLDADHLLQFLDLEMIARMGHSIPFAILVGFIMLAISKFRDFRLAAISFAAVISHLAFDIWLANQSYLNGTQFPLFSPFSADMIVLSGYDWLFLEIFAFGVVGIIAILNKKFGKTEIDSAQIKKFKNTL